MFARVTSIQLRTTVQLSDWRGIGQLIDVSAISFPLNMRVPKSKMVVFLTENGFPWTLNAAERSA